MSSPRFAVAAAAFVAMIAPRVAHAGTFTDDGTFVFDREAAATFDFETMDDSGGLMGMADDHALSGASIVKLAPQMGYSIPVTLPKERRTYRVSVWARAAETVAYVLLRYDPTGGTSDFASMYPTGRITSDGWVELAAERVRVDGPRLVSASVSFFSANGCDIDALELAPDGDATSFPAIPNAPCRGATDAGACADDQVCIWSECRDVNGWVPSIPKNRDDVAAYLANRIELLFGPYLERHDDLPASRVAFEQMKNAQTPWAYWNGFTLGVRRLHDGHTSTNGLADFILRNPKPLAICFLEGDGDLTQAAAPKDPDYLDVLVSHVGADHNLGLGPGDRLVHVDGLHPIAWARSLIQFNWGQPSISNHTTFAELASSLRSMISRYAGTIDVIRCPGGACGAMETISIADLPVDPPMTMFDFVDCDNRPVRHVPGAPANHQMGDTLYEGLVNESDAVEKIHGLEWESLYTTDGQDGVGAGLHQAVTAWTNDARGVILDHRSGFGGTILAPQILWAFAIPAHPGDTYVDRQFFEAETPTPAEGQALWMRGPETVGSANPVTDLPIALMITQDVSASDWLPYGMKGGPNVKVFGPFQTNGGFSTRYSFGYWLSIGYIAAVGDTFGADGVSFNGRGIEPDVVVMPKQSDLVSGKDTVYEAALAWVRQGLKP